MDDIATLQRRFVEAHQSDGKVDVGREFIADDFVNNVCTPGFFTDKQGVLDLFAMFHAALPDFRVEIHDLFADGDRVVT
jgi:predicted ester cyclase